MQEHTAAESSAEPRNINQMGSHIPSALHPQRICSAKLYALRTARHGAQREHLPKRPSLDQAGKNQKTRSAQGAYRIVMTVRVVLSVGSQVFSLNLL